MDLYFIAKYPFSSSAKSYLEKIGVKTINYDDIRMAEERIREDIKNHRGPEILESVAEKQLKSFALARAILAATKNSNYIFRFAAAEAQSMVDSIERESEEVKMQLGKELFPSLKNSHEEYSLSIFDYTKYAKDWEGVELEAGNVYLPEVVFFSGIFKNALVFRIADIKNISVDSLAQEVRDAAEEISPSLNNIIKNQSPKYARAQGKFLSLGCIQFIRKGLSEGRRFYGAMALSIACLKDGLSSQQAKEVMKEYVSKCVQSPHEFTEREALNTLEWVYKKGSMGFSCSVMQAQGFGGDYCKNCWLGKYTKKKKR